MNDQMKGITCCGDCAYYDWKKHSCPRAKERGNSQSRFYVDCPLPDARPVVRGKWIILRGNINCSECGYYADRHTFKYCPDCGAIMKVECDSENPVRLSREKLRSMSAAEINREWDVISKELKKNEYKG